MKGPKRFNEEERRDVAERAKRLEARIADIDTEIRLHCQKLTAFTRGYSAQLQANLGGGDNILNILPETQPFSSNNPELTFESIGSILFTTTDIAQSSRIGYLGEFYAKARKRLMRDFKPLFDRQVEAYEAMLSNTMVEMPFVQIDVCDTALLYVLSDEKNGSLFTTADWRAGKHEPLAGTDFTSAEAYTSAGIERLTKLAEHEKANVYLITSPSRIVNNGLVVAYVLDRLQREYDQAHPEAAAERKRANAERAAGAFVDLLSVLKNIAEARSRARHHAGSMWDGAVADDDVERHGVISREKYEVECPTCPGKDICPKYVTAQAAYSQDSTKPGQGGWMN